MRVEELAVPSASVPVVEGALDSALDATDVGFGAVADVDMLADAVVDVGGRGRDGGCGVASSRSTGS